MTTLLRAVAIVALLAGIASGQSTPKNDLADYGAYQPGSGVSGRLTSVGSDTLNTLMTDWLERFKRHHPGADIQIEGKGSNTAPPAITAGTSQLAPMSRPMKDTELESFEARNGYKPTEIRVAVDALAVFVHKDNPIQVLTLDQVDGIFSKVRRRGSNEIRTWGQLGLTGEWADRPLRLYGRNPASGTYTFFKEQALKLGDFKEEVKEQTGSSNVALGVSEDRYGIGYSGVGYVSSGVRAVPLAEKNAKDAAAPTRENATSGDYPLSRYLYIYVNRAPGKVCDPIVSGFIRMICSKEGQEIVMKQGFYPIPPDVAKEELKKLE